MSNLKPVISANLVALRKSKNLTQAELAQKFNYSPQAISRWERGDAMPEIDVLQDFCDFYGITLDALVHQSNVVAQKKAPEREIFALKISMCALTVSIVWLLATFLFVYHSTVKGDMWWQVFVYAIPVSCFLLSFANRRWGAPFNHTFTLVSVSLFVWSLITAVYIYFLSYNMWLLYLIGIPAQITIILWYRIKLLKQ